MDKHLQSAVKEPRFVHTEDGGSVIALALHCVMVEHGFRVAAEKKFGGGTSAFSPAADWHGKYTNEWIFDYNRAGYASGFQLHCSLQPGSGKMFVHAREADSPTNMRYMGLLVDKYVPVPAKAKGNSWEGVLAEQEALEHQLVEYVIEPLLAAAVPLQEADDAQSPPSEEWITQLSSYFRTTYDSGISRRSLLLAGAALAAASVGVYFLAKSRRPV